MHGPDECAGNIQQLCVAKYHPLQTWWEFVMCQHYQTRENIGRPDVALKCARAAQIDWETSGPGQCAGLDASGKADEGIQLLKESIAATQALDIRYVTSDVDVIMALTCFTARAAPLSSTVNKCAFTTEPGRNARYVDVKIPAIQPDELSL